MSVEQENAVQNQLLDLNDGVGKVDNPADVRPDPIRMPEEDDPDMIELREAEAAVAAANKALEDQSGPEAVKPPAVDPKAAAPAAKPADQQPRMVPIERLNEVIQQRDQVKEQLNYVKGIADARHEMAKQPVQPQADAQPTAPVKTAKDILNEISAAKVNLAEKYEAGEITAVQWKTHEVALDDAAASVRDQTHKVELDLVRQEAKTEAQKAVQDQSLARQAEKLEAEHPYAKILTNDQFAVLNKIAGDRLVAKGVDPRTNMFQFREELANLTDEFGPAFTGKQLGAANTQQNPDSKAQSVAQQNAPSGAGTKLSELAKARMDKINLSTQQPPDTNSIGSQGGSAPEITESQLMKMTDDEVANLPLSTQQRFLARAS